MAKSTKSRLGRGLSSLISVSDGLPVEREIEHADGELSPTRIEEQREDASTSAAAAGGGLTELSQDVPVASQSRGAPIELPIDRISPNPHQPRRRFNEAALNELAASLKSNGLVQPIVVRPAGDRYELVAGERRWRAARLAGLSAIPAIIRDVDVFTQAQLALVENIHRKDLNPVERASAYRALIDQLGLTQAELAHRLGEDRTTIANFLRILELPDSVQTLVEEEKISLGHAKVIAGISDPAEQEHLALLTVTQELTVRNLERLVNNPGATPAAKPRPALAAHFQGLEKSFARRLGMRVQIRPASGSKSKGRVVIHYGSLDQFDQLMEMLEIENDSAT